MGMSASQVRFLTLQDRKSTIGMQLGVLSNRKMALSRDMTNAAREYNEAFAATTLQWYDSINGEYTDITYSSLMMPNAGNAYTPYLLSDRVTGNVILDSTVGGVGEDVINLLNQLTGNSPTNPYKPGTVEFNDNMKLDIIEDIMQVPNFDRNKIAYHPIENTTIFEGGVQRFTQSEIIDSLGNVGIGDLYLDSKVAENISTNGGYGWDSDVEGHDSYENNGQETTGVFTSDGSQITVNENTWWSTLYNNNAVVCVGSRYRYDSGNTYSPGNSYEFVDDRSWDFGHADSWVSAFVDAVINSEPVKNSGINYNRNAIITAAKKAIRTFNGGNEWYNYEDVGDPNAAITHANVDLRIYNEITTTKDGDDEIAVIKYKDGDGNYLGGTSWVAGAKQANLTTGVVAVYSYSYITRTNGTEPNTIDVSCIDATSFYMSVKNMMDVVLYYFSLYAEEGAIPADKDFFQSNFDAAKEGNFKDITEPGRYRGNSLDIFTQGETKIPSMASIYSNLKLLETKLVHMGHPNTGHGEWGLFTKAIPYIEGFLSGEKQATKDDLIAIANMNAWVCKALTDAEDYDDIRNYMDNAYAAYNLQWDWHPTDGGWYGVSTAEGWNAMQDNPNRVDGFYYDGPNAVEGNHGLTNFSERTQLFSQTSVYGEATWEVDIESQLDVKQMKELGFYISLVKSCLQKGWQGVKNLDGDSERLTLQLQNNRWLLNEMNAKSSSRIFEIKNKEAREEALSEYETKQAELSAKEERIDIKMQQLRTEQTALDTEMDALQKIIDDNIGSTFKIFS